MIYLCNIFALKCKSFDLIIMYFIPTRRKKDFAVWIEQKLYISRMNISCCSKTAKKVKCPLLSNHFISYKEYWQNKILSFSFLCCNWPWRKNVTKNFKLKRMLQSTLLFLHSLYFAWNNFHQTKICLVLPDGAIFVL